MGNKPQSLGFPYVPLFLSLPHEMGVFTSGENRATSALSHLIFLLKSLTGHRESSCSPRTSIELQWEIPYTLSTPILLSALPPHTLNKFQAHLQSQYRRFAPTPSNCALHQIRYASNLAIRFSLQNPPAELICITVDKTTYYPRSRFAPQI